MEGEGLEDGGGLGEEAAVPSPFLQHPLHYVVVHGRRRRRRLPTTRTTTATSAGTDVWMDGWMELFYESILGVIIVRILYFLAKFPNLMLLFFFLNKNKKEKREKKKL